MEDNEKTGTDNGQDGQMDPARYKKSGKLRRSFYDSELLRLQEELVKMQYWVRTKN